MSLAEVRYSVTPEDFTKLQEAFTTEFKQGGNHTETSGTVVDHGATVDYGYDSDKQCLTLKVEAIHRVLFAKPSLDETLENLDAFVYEFVPEAKEYEEPQEQTEPEPEQLQLQFETQTQEPSSTKDAAVLPEGNQTEAQDTQNSGKQEKPTGFAAKVAAAQS